MEAVLQKIEKIRAEAEKRGPAGRDKTATGSEHTRQSVRIHPAEPATTACGCFKPN